MSLGDLLKSWQQMVSAQRADFHSQASTVAKWDMDLRRAHVDLHDLECSVTQLTEDSRNVDARLQSVEGTMLQMQEQLGAVEAELDEHLRQHGGGGGDAVHGAAQRARMGAYSAALELDDMLKHLEDKLADIEAHMRSEQQELSADPVRGGAGRGGAARARATPPIPTHPTTPSTPTKLTPHTHTHTHPLAHTRAPAAVRFAGHAAPGGEQLTGAGGGGGAREIGQRGGGRGAGGAGRAWRWLQRERLRRRGGWRKRDVVEL